MPADLAGSWLGRLDLGPIALRLGFNFTASATGDLSGSLVSIDQGGTVVPVSSIKLSDGKLNIAISAIGAKFQGSVDSGADSIDGDWSQGSIEAALVLRRVDKLPGQERPQHPRPPFPYRAEEVRFENPSGGHTLAGTLTLPKGAGPFGAVVFVSGSGAQDRDESLMGHKPFLVLADALTRRGVAVLRYDDRGYGESSGDFGAATSRDFASDAIAAIRFIAKRDDIRSDAIGICGHSEGGMIGPMVAAARPEEVAFLVLIAPPGMPGDQVLATQAAALEKKMGVPPEAIKAMATARRKLFELATTEKLASHAMRTKSEAILAEVPDSYFIGESDPVAARKAVGNSLAILTTPWMRYFVKHDPRADLRRVQCPVLAVIGEKDMQVLPDVNLDPLQTALNESPSRDVTVRELPGLNHLLQTAQTGMPTEYNQIEETIAPEALELISSWTAERVAVKP